MTLKEIGYQLYLTFSEQPSVLSSKKIERFIVFSVMLGNTIVYLGKNMKTMDATSFMIVIGGWLGYAGYNTLLNFKDKQLDKTNTNDQSQSDIPKT